MYKITKTTLLLLINVPNLALTAINFYLSVYRHAAASSVNEHDLLFTILNGMVLDNRAISAEPIRLHAMQLLHSV